MELADQLHVGNDHQRLLAVPVARQPERFDSWVNVHRLQEPPADPQAVPPLERDLDLFCGPCGVNRDRPRQLDPITGVEIDPPRLVLRK